MKLGNTWRIASIVAACCVGCADSRAPAAEQQKLLPPTIPIDTPAADPADDMIDRRVAVFMHASDADIERMRAEVSPADFEVIADDAMFYRASALELLEQHGVEIIGIDGRTPLTFMVAGQPRTYDFSDLSWFDVVVLYAPGREPLAIAPVEAHRAAEYFR